MERVSRRSFFKQAGFTAGLAGVAIALPGAPVGASRRPELEPPLSAVEASKVEPIVAQVRDAASGEIAVFVGEREITIHDHHVASRLVRAAR